jgi:hypothetical protein
MHSSIQILDNNDDETSQKIKQIKKINIIMLTTFCILCFYIIFGAYEFTYNFNIDLQFADIISYKDDITIYIFLIIIEYVLLIFSLFFGLISLRLYKHKIEKGGKGIFLFISVVVVYLSLSLNIYCISNILMINISIKNRYLMLFGPIDMIIFTFFLIFGLIVPFVIFGIFWLINFAYKNIYQACIDDRLI